MKPWVKKLIELNRGNADGATDNRCHVVADTRRVPDWKWRLES